MAPVSRREFFSTGSKAGLAAAMLLGVPLVGVARAAGAGEVVAGAGTGAGASAGAGLTLWPGFPRQDANLVRQIVGAAHSREEEVRTLVAAKPALVNAWWDWGFGDWESPLGAASHRTT